MFILLLINLTTLRVTILNSDPFKLLRSVLLAGFNSTVTYLSQKQMKNNLASFLNIIKLPNEFPQVHLSSYCVSNKIYKREYDKLTQLTSVNKRLDIFP